MVPILREIDALPIKLSIQLHSVDYFTHESETTDRCTSCILPTYPSSSMV